MATTEDVRRKGQHVFFITTMLMMSIVKFWRKLNPKYCKKKARRWKDFHTLYSRICTRESENVGHGKPDSSPQLITKQRMETKRTLSRLKTYSHALNCTVACQEKKSVVGESCGLSTILYSS